MEIISQSKNQKSRF